jgi:hypothetical protein
MAIKQREVPDRSGVAVAERAGVEGARARAEARVATREKQLLGIAWGLLILAFVAIPVLETWKFATSFLLFLGMVVVLLVLFHRFRPQT